MRFHNELIAQLREKKSMTQTDLARKIGTTRQVVSSWEAGDTEPRIRNLVAVCEVFGVDIDAFFSFE